VADEFRRDDKSDHHPEPPLRRTGRYVRWRREEGHVAKFVTIGYGDRQGYDRTAPAVRDEAHAHDDRLRSTGVDMGIAGAPVQVRNHDAAGVEVERGR
jgi:hypothetical protein